MTSKSKAIQNPIHNQHKQHHHLNHLSQWSPLQLLLQDHYRKWSQKNKVGKKAMSFCWSCTGQTVRSSSRSDRSHYITKPGVNAGLPSLTTFKLFFRWWKFARLNLSRLDGSCIEEKVNKNSDTICVTSCECTTN